MKLARLLRLSKTSQLGTRPWMEEITKRSGGAITMDRKSDESLQMMRSAGLTTTPLSPEFRSKLAESLHGMGEAWAQDMDNRGRPGTQLAQEFRAKVAAARNR